MANASSPRHIYLKTLPGDKTAITVYPFIFWSRAKRGWEQSRIMTHELYHWHEQRQWRETKYFGLLRWLMKYIMFWLWFNVARRLPLREHPMEKPAHAAERKI